MSNQSNLGYTSDNQPLFTRLYGTDEQYFNQLTSPPLSIFNHSILYSVLSDVAHPFWNGVPLALLTDIPVSGGDVVGPNSATDNAICRYDTTTGKLIQNSAIDIDDNGFINNVSGMNFIFPLPSGYRSYLAQESASGLAGSDVGSSVTGPWATPPQIPWAAERCGNMVMLSLGPAIGLNDGSANAIAIDFGANFANFIPVGNEQHTTMVIRDAGVDKMVSVYVAPSSGDVIQISSNFNVPAADSLAPFSAGSTGQTGFPNSIMLSWIIPASP